MDFIKEDELYCLIDGIWHKFNSAYVEYLKEEVNSIELLEYDSNFNIKSDVVEDKFNKDRIADGYMNFDKQNVKIGRYTVEKLDLYKDNVAYFVKKGDSQKLSYVVDQAVNTAKILQNNVDTIQVNGKSVEIKGICLWLIYDRRTPITKLSDINSIILHMKLVEWKKVLIDVGISPLIRINYVIR